MEQSIDYKKEFSKICRGCQDCCKWITFIVQNTVLTKGLKEHYKVRGYKFRPYGSDQTGVMIPSVCPKLKPEGCSVYWRRPEYCKAYDGRKDPFMGDKCELP